MLCSFRKEQGSGAEPRPSLWKR